MRKKLLITIGAVILFISFVSWLGNQTSSQPEVKGSQIQEVSPTITPTIQPTFTPTPTLIPTSTPTLVPTRVPTPTVQVTTNSGLSNDNYYTNVDGNQVHSPAYSNNVPAGASAICRDGTYSFSQNRRGTCSGHGGVAQWL